MKEKVIILAEGGACGHFICTLLQTLHAPDRFNKVDVPEHGGMDLIALSGSMIMDHLWIGNQYKIYPESDEGMDLIMYALKNPDTYKLYLREYEKEFHETHVLHYQWPKHIYRFLYLPNTKVILVKYNANDYKRIAVNKITKNFTTSANPSGALPRLKRGYENLLVWAGFGDSDEINELRSLTDTNLASKKLVNTLIHVWEIYIDKRNINSDTLTHNNLLILNFNDLYFNKEIIMQSLSEFAGLPINDTTRSIYDDYLSKQPNIDLY